MSMSYIYSLLNIETTPHEVEVVAGQFEFLIVLLFDQLVCLFISKVTCNLCFHGKH